MSGGACTECINEKGGFFASGRFGTVFTLLAQFRFRCAEVVLQPKTYEPPNISTVGAKCFRCAEVLLQPKTYEPPDGNISTVGAKCFRCAEVLIQSEEIGLCATGRGVMKFYEAGAALVQDLGADLATQPCYVANITPVIHYCMGGVEIDKIQKCCVRIPSPFLPSNRLGGNSLLVCVVFGRVVGVACAQYRLGDRAKATSLAALAGGGKVEGSKKSGQTTVADGGLDGKKVGKVISGADFAA